MENTRKLNYKTVAEIQRGAHMEQGFSLEYPFCPKKGALSLITRQF